MQRVFQLPLMVFVGKDCHLSDIELQEVLQKRLTSDCEELTREFFIRTIPLTQQIENVNRFLDAQTIAEVEELFN